MSVRRCKTTPVVIKAITKRPELYQIDVNKANLSAFWSGIIIRTVVVGASVVGATVVDDVVFGAYNQLNKILDIRQLKILNQNLCIPRVPSINFVAK